MAHEWLNIDTTPAVTTTLDTEFQIDVRQCVQITSYTASDGLGHSTARFGLTPAEEVLES